MNKNKGFSLVELMLAVAVSSIVLLVMHAVYSSQQKSYMVQGQTSVIQQNLRGGLCFMERDIRMAGYDPKNSGSFGITDIRLDKTGNGTLQFTLDNDLNNTKDVSDENGTVDGHETFVYALYDYPTASPDGIPDLGRKYGTKRQLLAQNIYAMGFAFAFDRINDNDNDLDRDSNGNIIWAIDTDGDNLLDVNLDTDHDGDIDIHDNDSGESLGTPANGYIPDITLSEIRAVKIWLLAGARKENSTLAGSGTFVVSNQRIAPNDGIPRRILMSTVRCRNLAMDLNY